MFDRQLIARPPFFPQMRSISKEAVSSWFCLDCSVGLCDKVCLENTELGGHRYNCSTDRSQKRSGYELCSLGHAREVWV